MHYAEEVEVEDGVVVELKSEVAILSRNVKIQGDATTADDTQVGGVFMVHTTGGASSVARIDSVEFNHVGQAFADYRHPVHFHMVSDARDSFVKNCVITDSYSRAIGLSGVKNLLVENNVIYGSAGHGIFTGYGAESGNTIDSNLIIDTRRSWVLQESDLRPAGIYLTGPRNIVTNNRAAGSDGSGYTYDLLENSVGPQYNPDICPVYAEFGTFAGNVAHSCQEHGLLIANNYSPRTYECEAMEYDASASFPYELNQPVTATLESLAAYKNVGAGVMADKIGDIHFDNFALYDNIGSGIEVQEIDIADGYAQIYAGVLVGNTGSSNDTLLLEASPAGIVTPRTENLTIELS